MKPLTTLLTLLILSSAKLFAQWQPDVQLTNNPASSHTSYKNSIAVSGNVVHVVWYDQRDGVWQIYYKRSTNAGKNWETDTRLTNTNDPAYEPALSVSGEIVNVFWADEDQKIYYKRSLNAGISWSPIVKLTNHSFKATSPSAAVSGSNVHLVWTDGRDAPEVFEGDMIYYKRSTNGGFSWGPDIKINDKLYSSIPLVAVSGQLVHVVWQVIVNGDANKPMIYYKRSTDAGITWGAEIKLSDGNYSRGPSLAVSGQNVHIIWTDHRHGKSEIYHKHSPNGGISWGADSRITNDPYESNSPSISVLGQIVHLVWVDNRPGGLIRQLYYKRSINGGVSWEADTRLTNNTSDFRIPGVFASGLIVHVVWHNEREIFYKRQIKESIKNLRPIQQNTTTSVVSKVEEKVEETSENKIERNDSEKWVITPTGAKGAAGIVSVNLPADVVWDLDIKSITDQALGRYYNQKTHSLIPGEYNIFLTYLPVMGVPVQKGMNTRLKAGILDVVTTGQWSIHDESKAKVYVTYYKPSKIGLPVGKYNIQLGGQYQQIEIKDGEVTEF